ncbi:E1-E2 ATPase family protein [Mycobacterium ulcerans str. Harvey]|uniref:E1-E2 ATPase family protein n=1 Tax=Mycobacterium ulcerans str. Harvey TaxID=1299332 RepID=A0ABN0QSK8_MYCUL|nr:E1-E2 ATPase family protein [Mycobacterium ulcerans str. Harvey]
MLYAGTTVVAGTAVAVVTAVGADTQERRAADLVSGDLSNVGLQHQLSQLTNRAWPVSMTGGAVVTGLGLLRRQGLRQAVASGIAVTVAAVPEGMPLVATLAQQASARRLTHFGALVRIPRSVEALGRVDMVCFDKTETLSENRLRVAQVHPGPAFRITMYCAARSMPRRPPTVDRRYTPPMSRSWQRHHRNWPPNSTGPTLTCHSAPAGRFPPRCQTPN